MKVETILRKRLHARVFLNAFTVGTLCRLNSPRKDITSVRAIRDDDVYKDDYTSLNDGVVVAKLGFEEDEMPFVDKD